MVVRIGTEVMLDPLKIPGLSIARGNSARAAARDPACKSSFAGELMLSSLSITDNN